MSDTFAAMGLKAEVLKSLEELNFKVPTPIQQQAIPFILKNDRDLIAFAQTGTGKTAAFSLPIINQIDPSSRKVQAIILCPTRELCLQISKDLKLFTKHLPAVRVAAIYGGASMHTQLRELKDGVQIVVGTPGRVQDLINRGRLELGSISWLVLDEADDMLDKGFKDELDAIISETPENKQTLLFSATMSSWIEKVARQKMHNPEQIKVSPQSQGADTVEHKYVAVHARDRYEALRRLLDVNPDVYGIVFCRTKRQTKEVAAKLIANNYFAEAIHGDMEQSERTETMERFKKGVVKLLIATDVAARGIDVNELTHVINYELPDSPETYVHRSGRTGRAGNKGISLTIINLKEHGKLRRIEQVMRKKFEEIQVPKGKDICEAQLLSLVHSVRTTEVDHENLKPYLDRIYEELEGLDRDSLIQHFVSAEFNRFLAYYSNTKDISSHSVPARDRNDSRGKLRSGRAKGLKMNSYKVNLGRKHKFSHKDLFSLVNKNQSLRGVEIGNIKIGTEVTQFEADARYNDKLLKFLGREKFKQMPVKIIVFR